MRVVSLGMRDALFAQESGEVLIFLLTITHPELDDPIYLSTDPTSRLSDTPLIYQTTSRAINFIYAGIAITLPTDEDKTPPASKLVVDNITRDIIPLARSVSTPPSVTIEAVLASDLDTVEMTWPALDMTSLTYDGTSLTFDLTIDAMLTEPYPSGTFNPSEFQGLFF